MSQATLRLQFLPLPTLWDLNHPDAKHAIKQRMHAFHEAGHVWAAHRSGLAPASASRLDDGPTFITNKARTTAWIAAMGPYTQGLLVEADQVRVEENIPADDPGVLFEGEQEFFDADTIRSHINTLRHPCCCRRGGDAIATNRLADLDWIEQQLVAVLVDWTNIEALAQPILAGRTLDAHAIDTLLRTQPV